MKTSRDPIPVVLVGGGSVLLDELPGASMLVRPGHFAVANAVGAAIAQVGGEIDRVFSLDAGTRADAITEATAEATRRAVEAGARPETIRIVDVEEVGLGYLPGNALRLKVKAVGDLALEEERAGDGHARARPGRPARPRPRRGLPRHRRRRRPVRRPPDGRAGDPRRGHGRRSSPWRTWPTTRS